MLLSGSKHWEPINRRRWADVRRAALDRDNWRCRECGKAGRLEVHHVQALEHGGEPYELSNTRTLCREHHLRIHGGTPQHEQDPAFQALVQDLLS